MEKNVCKLSHIHYSPLKENVGNSCKEKHYNWGKKSIWFRCKM